MSRIRHNLHARARLIMAIRQFFHDLDYLEVETPIRIPAPAPETHIDAPASESWFLHTSPELCMKRLLAAGYLRIFQICRCFRKGERGGRHLPEFTLLEWYTANEDYHHMMTQCEALVCHAAESLGTGKSLVWRNVPINLAPPWDRLTVSDAFDQFASMPMEDALVHDRFDELMGIEIEPNLGWDRPVFLCDYPSEMAALARLMPQNPRFAERFELYIGGVELCNAFSELTDPSEQRIRFEEERHVRQHAGKTIYPMPEKFLHALEHMPDATGNALGIDRLAMLFTGSETIDDVVAFYPEIL